jgi:tRNA-splicing ligase RtcB
MVAIGITKPHKIYADLYTIETEAIRQFENVMSHDAVIRGALMPDCHTGYTVPIGCVFESDRVIFPAAIGYDIGCSVSAMKLPIIVDDMGNIADKIKDMIIDTIPLGNNHHKYPVKQSTMLNMSIMTNDMSKIFMDKGGLKQLGTLGGGKMVASSPRV